MGIGRHRFKDENVKCTLKKEIYKIRRRTIPIQDSAPFL